MKHLALVLPLLLLAATSVRAADVTPGNATPGSVTTANAKGGRAENVAQCFVVRNMYKSQDIRYYVDAVSHCSREYEAVYVMVSFLDSAGNSLGDGMWAIYWCRPGLREVHEFGVPSRAVGFDRVVLRKITTDNTEALR